MNRSTSSILETPNVESVPTIKINACAADHALIPYKLISYLITYPLGIIHSEGSNTHGCC